MQCRFHQAQVGQASSASACVAIDGPAVYKASTTQSDPRFAAQDRYQCRQEFPSRAIVPAKRGHLLIYGTRVLASVALSSVALSGMCIITHSCIEAHTVVIGPKAKHKIKERQS